MTPISGFLCFAAVLLALAGGPIYAAWALFGLGVVAQAAPVLYGSVVMAILRRYSAAQTEEPPAEYDQAVAGLSDKPKPHNPEPEKPYDNTLRLRIDPEGPIGDEQIPEDTRIAAL